MPAKDDKPERRRRRRRRRRRPKRKQEESERFDGLKSRLEQGPLGDKDKKVVIEPKGQLKMSDVLEAYVAPYLGETASIEDDRKLFMLAIAAWNAALFPEDSRQEMIEQLLEGIAPGDAALRANMREIVDELVARKLEHFADIDRAIIDFDLRDTGDGYELQVASTLKPPQ